MLLCRCLLALLALPAFFCTGAKLFIGSKAPCMFCFEILIPEGEKREGMQFSKQSTQTLWPCRLFVTLQSLMLTRSCWLGDCFYWKLLSEFTTCPGWMAAVVLPTSPAEYQNQAWLKPTERVIPKPCISCPYGSKGVFLDASGAM